MNANSAWLGPAIALAAIFAFSCTPPETRILPIKGVRFGQSVKKVQSLRSDASSAKCPESITLLTTCLEEANPSPGLFRATWGFTSEGGLAYVDLAVDDFDTDNDIVSEFMGRIPGLGDLGPAEPHLYESAPVTKLGLRWENEKLGVKGFIALLDEVLIAGSTNIRKASEFARRGILRIGTGVTLWDPRQITLDFSGEVVAEEEARVAMNAFASRVRRRAQLVSVFSSGTVMQEHCDALDSFASIEGAFCSALVTAVENGRTTPVSRSVLTELLKDRGYFPFRGFMVARIDKTVYEVARVRSTYFGLVPTQDRVLLRTTATEFSSKGNFSLWVRRTGSQKITTKDGFVQEWDIYEEDAIGTAVKEIFDAHPGESTSQAARDLLVEFAAGSIDW